VQPYAIYYSPGVSCVQELCEEAELAAAVATSGSRTRRIGNIGSTGETKYELAGTEGRVLRCFHDTMSIDALSRREAARSPAE
jgi:hypothetical protein